MTVRKADRGWVLLAAYVAAHNVRAAGRGDEMLSMAVDRYLVAHPLLTRAVVAVIALHLTNCLPERFDILHQIFSGTEQFITKFG